MAPPPRIPLDLRLTEEEWIPSQGNEKNFGKAFQCGSDLVENENMNSTVDLVANKLKEDEIMQAAANK